MGIWVELLILLPSLPLACYEREVYMSALAVLSDSGTISEESSIMNFPALNIREASPSLLHPFSPSLRHAERSRSTPSPTLPFMLSVADYSMPNVSDKVVRIILSYTDYILRTVWSEK